MRDANVGIIKEIAPKQRLTEPNNHKNKYWGGGGITWVAQCMIDKRTYIYDITILMLHPLHMVSYYCYKEHRSNRK